jgi:hypothetical protein
MKACFSFLLILSLFGFVFPQKSTPWEGKIQELPGKLECEYYDLGGEGLAYHDADEVNNGSGKLNPANGSFLNEFRMKEAVDISFTKAKDIDNSPYNKVVPEMEKLYVGWTEPGEWLKYTVKIKKSGIYYIGLMYTANGDGKIALDVDGKRVTSDLKVASTNHPDEPVAWRQWHHWNKSESLAIVKLKKGTHVLTLHTVAHGQMNYDYLEFSLIP